MSKVQVILREEISDHYLHNSFLAFVSRKWGLKFCVLQKRIHFRSYVNNLTTNAGAIAIEKVLLAGSMSVKFFWKA